MTPDVWFSVITYVRHVHQNFGTCTWSRTAILWKLSNPEQYFDNIQNELKDVAPCNIWNNNKANMRKDPGTRKYVMKWGEEQSIHKG